ncbi:MAG TPA: hypothetical protein VHT03_12180 [Rhizomicrobium sp.]|jgi:hypothetical protein|nr:hypothetical protein [Rhizomicrobium sp.]
MIKLCLLGNSHAGALKLGWDIVKSNFPNCDVTVFAAPGKRIDDLQVRGRRLVADSVRLRRFLKRISGVGGSFSVRRYDRFLVCGSGFHAGVPAGFLAKARIDTEPKDERQPLSLPLFMRMVEADLRAASAILTVEKLRRITRKPIGLIPLPLRIEQSEWAAEKAILGSGTPQKLADCFAAAARTIADSLNCEMFTQPPFTKAGPLRSKSEYAKGSTRLVGNRLHGSDNVVHMNAAYGAALWHVILADPAWSGEKAGGAVVAKACDAEPDAIPAPAFSSFARASFESGSAHVRASRSRTSVSEPIPSRGHAPGA